MTSEISRRTIRQWLSRPFQWRIPVYQRHYSWDAKEEAGPIHLFWEDTVKKQALARIKAKKSGKMIPHPHYFGAVLVEKKEISMDGVQPFDVVDGQQRLTTLSVALFAIIGLAIKNGLDGKIKSELANYVFTDEKVIKNETIKPEDQKLLPTNYDREQYKNLLLHAYKKQDGGDKKRKPNHDKSMVVRACNFFRDEFEEFVIANDKGDPEIPLRALLDTLLDGFDIVVIPLAKSDEAQLVFEAMNNTARPLTTFDLIRNNIFYRADKEEPRLDEKLFDTDEWQEFEDTFWEEPFNKEGDDKHIETYIARMLVAKQKRFLLLNRESIFKEYKTFAAEFKDKGEKIDSMTGVVGAEIQDISEYVDTYQYLVGKSQVANPTTEGKVECNFGYFKEYHKESVVFLPLIFTIATCDASVEEKQKMIDLLHSWYIRRRICELTGDYNKQIPTICKVLGAKPSYGKLYKFLAEHDEDTSTKVLPSDKKVESALLSRNFYKDRKFARYVFGHIVLYETTESRNDKRDLVGLTIDHIFPTSWDETKWENVVKNDDYDEVDTKIQTIGNLTPMEKGVNSGKSNLTWGECKKSTDGARGWLVQSDLKMTRDLADKPKWDLDEIDARTKELARAICDIWPAEID